MIKIFANIKSITVLWKMLNIENKQDGKDLQAHPVENELMLIVVEDWDASSRHIKIDRLQAIELISYLKDQFQI